MRYKPCDELGADLLAARSQWGCATSPVVARKLIEYVTSRYDTGEFENLLERALDLELIAGETERHAYKCALGLFFNKRAQYAREQIKARDAIPFAPR